MLWTPGGSDSRIITNTGIVGATNPGTTVTSGGTTNTYTTTPVELISAAANNRDSWGIGIGIFNTGASATASEACVDILIGGATDDVLISSLICGFSWASGPRYYFFPLHIPSGKRIAAIHSNVRVSAAATVACWLFQGSESPFRVGSRVTTYGTKTNNSRGVAITPTASAGAASVTQITASTSRDHFAFAPGFQVATDTTVTPAGFVNVGIGVGAATEQRIGTWFFGKDTSEVMTGPFPPMPAFVDVPSGTRLTLLASNSGTNDTAYDGLIYAVS